MKKSKMFIIGVVLCVIGVVGVFGLFSETQDKAALAFGSVLFAAVGVVLIVIDKKQPKPQEPADIHAQAEEAKKNHDYYSFRVAGVTFNNGRKTRQALLRKIKYGDEPFDNFVDWELKKYDFEGSEAVGVYANDEQVGNVPKENLSFVLDNWDRIVSVYHTEITGGGETPEGEKLNFGCEVTLCLNKQ